MIRITLTIDLSDFWGADDAWSDGGEGAVRELCMEDIGALIEEAKWKIEKIEPLE